MSLVTYSDSEDGTDEIEKQVSNQEGSSIAPLSSSKRKRSNDNDAQSRSKPPPLPSNFTTLYASTVRSSTNDDPTLHSGRKRQIPHIEGNWPSFVYLEWLPSPKNLVSLEEVIARIAEEHESTTNSPSSKDEVQNSLRSELGVRLPLHVSLSTPLILTTDNKDVFRGTLIRTINTANLAEFCTTPSSIRWVKNFDETRHFLILTMSRPEQDELQSLLSVCNQTAANLGLPQLYAGDKNSRTDGTKVGVAQSPASDSTCISQEHTAPNHDSFHISIAWSLTPIQTTQKLMDELMENLKSMIITFDSVYIKIGNVVTSIPLGESSSQISRSKSHSN